MAYMFEVVHIRFFFGGVGGGGGGEGMEAIFRGAEFFSIQACCRTSFHIC